MSEIGESSGTDREKEDDCAKLAKEIDELINRNKHEANNKGTHGLQHRFRELISNMRKQIETGKLTQEAKDLWKTHYDQIIGHQAKLQRLLKEYQKKGCGDPPPGAWSWAEREVPTYEQMAAESGISLRDVAIVSAGAGFGYIIYRVVRFLPSLLPPLWETIPANLAIP